MFTIRIFECLNVSTGLWEFTTTTGNDWFTQVGGGVCDDVAYRSSYAWSSRWKTIDLTDTLGFSREFLDQSPPISISDWVKSRGESPDYYSIEVKHL